MAIPAIWMFIPHAKKILHRNLLLKTLCGHIPICRDACFPLFRARVLNPVIIINCCFLCPLYTIISVCIWKNLEVLRTEEALPETLIESLPHFTPLIFALSKSRQLSVYFMKCHCAFKKTSNYIYFHPLSCLYPSLTQQILYLLTKTTIISFALPTGR